LGINPPPPQTGMGAFKYTHNHFVPCPVIVLYGNSNEIYDFLP